MENNQTLGKAVFHLWLSSLVPYMLFSLLTNFLYEGPILSSEYFFLFIGPSIYMYFFKKKYSKHFSLAFSRRVATYFTASFLLIYFSIAALYFYNLDPESIGKLKESFLILLISMLVITFSIYSIGSIGLTLMLSNEAGEFEVNYVKYIAIFVAICAISALIYMVATTIANKSFNSDSTDVRPINQAARSAAG